MIPGPGICINEMEVYALQLGSQQDYVVSGYTKDSQYVAVLDGHGRSHCIRALRALDMPAVMATENPALTLWNHSLMMGDTLHSGSTLTMARITGDVIEVWNVGDSQTCVFVNDELVCTSEAHTFSSEAEVERTKDSVRLIRRETAPFPVSDTRVEMVPTPRATFVSGEQLVPSQALGHNGITGFAPYYKKMGFKLTDKVRIVCTSDGVTDMRVDLARGSARDIVEEAQRRWNQSWEVYDGQKTYVSVFGSPDDISCAVWENVVEMPSLCIPYSLNQFTEADVREAFTWGPLERVEVEQGAHKAFFLHFNPGKLSDTMRNLYVALEEGKPVKLWIRPKFFWHIRLSHRGKPMKLAGWEYSRWTGGDYYAFAEEQVSDEACTCIKEFMTVF